MIFEIALVVLLTLTNGALAMSELAIVSSRKSRLRVFAEQGRRGSAKALALMEHPGRFLSTVQIGITLVGILAGAVSGATLGARLTDALAAAGVPPGVALPVGVGVVVALITYLSLIVGELVPKQIALRNPEVVASLVAPAMTGMSRVAAPVVWFLDVSGKAVLRLLGQTGDGAQTVTEEEIKMTLAEGQSAGILSAGENAMIAGVMRVADRTARALMTPRRDVEVIDLAQGREAALRKVRDSRRSRMPARQGGDDDIIGVIAVRDLLSYRPADGPFEEIVREVPIVLEQASSADVITKLRESPAHMVLVYDEYGHFEGIVTAMDVLEAITGTFNDEEGDEPAIVTRADGSHLVAGWMPVDEFADRFGLRLEPDAGYDTVAGFVLDQMYRIPNLGESFTFGGLTIEVVDLDGHRIDKLLVTQETRSDGA